jgi:hypothetical protein
LRAAGMRAPGPQGRRPHNTTSNPPRGHATGADGRERAMQRTASRGDVTRRMDAGAWAAPLDEGLRHASRGLSSTARGDLLDRHARACTGTAGTGFNFETLRAPARCLCAGAFSFCAAISPGGRKTPRATVIAFRAAAWTPAASENRSVLRVVGGPTTSHHTSASQGGDSTEWNA